MNIPRADQLPCGSPAKGGNGARASRYIVKCSKPDPWGVPGWDIYDTVTGETIGHPMTNARAWREADRLNNEIRSRAESVADWIASKPE
jgi:hypothetical protein